MSSLSRRAALPNVPSPHPERPSYARFIPREELGKFDTWNPDAFGAGRSPAPAAAAAAQEPEAEQWREQVAAARQAGYQDGYRDGMAALESFKQSHAAQMSQQLARLVQGFECEFDALHEQLAGAVTRTAVQLARQVLRSELELAPHHVASVAAEAVEAVLLSARHITVHVHPQDLPLVAAGAQEALQARGARLMADSGIQRGGCRVDSDVGSIDARIATRWAQAASTLGDCEPWSDDGSAQVQP